MAYTVFRLNHVHPDPSDGSEMSDRYRAALDMVEFLDQRGLNAVQFDEHHVSSTGWSPTPMMSAGMVLARTENVLCMIGALLLPLHDPIRVAEDLAVLDLVGKGRIVVTMGLGYRPLEYTAMDKEWSRRGKIMDESLDVLMKAWTGEPFEHHGETVQVLPKPFTSPHPQIMIGGSAKASARRAARLGLPLYMNGNPPGIKELYEELCAENGTVPFCIAPEEAPQLFITEDPDRAWAELGEHFHARGPHLRRLAARGSELAGALACDDGRRSARGRHLSLPHAGSGPRVRRRCGVLHASPARRRDADRRGVAFG